MNIIGIEALKSYLLALLALLGSILASLEAFWRTKNIQRENSFKKTAIVTVDLRTTLAGRNFRKIGLGRGY